MGTAYCLLYMHELNPPIAVVHLTSKEILLTDDYAAKVGFFFFSVLISLAKIIFINRVLLVQISDIAFWEELVTKSKAPAPAPAENESEHSLLPPLIDVETNVYCFGILLLQIISGRQPYSKEHGDLLNWVHIHSLFHQ